MTAAIAPVDWAAEVIAEAMTLARLAGDMPEEAAEAHIYDCWMEEGAHEALSEAVAHATNGAVILTVLAKQDNPLFTRRPF